MCSLLLLASLAVTASEDDGALRARFEKDAPTAWAALDSFCRRLSGTIVREARLTDRPWPSELGGQGLRETVQFKRRGNWTLTECLTERFWSDGKPPANTKPYHETIHGMNSRYGFQLYRFGPDEKFVLSNVIAPGPIVEMDYLRLTDYVMAHLRIIEWQPSQFIRLPGFELKSLSVETVEGHELVTLEFTFDNSRDPRLSVVNGKVHFDQKNSWAIRRSDMQFPKHRIRKVMEFGEKIDGFPLLRRIIGDMVYDHWPQGSRQVFKMEYSDIRQSEPPEYHFAVSAFGLPEIDSTLKQPTPVWLWFIALAAGTCILAIVFKWLGRQRASS